MGTIYANGVWSPARKEPIELHVLAGVIASAGSNAIGGRGKGLRQPQEFSAANQVEKVLIESLFAGGLVEGDRVYVADTQWWEIFTSDGIWKIHETTVWIPFTPSWFFTIGDGSASGAYFLKEGRATVTATIDLGTTGAFLSQFTTYNFLNTPTALPGRVDEIGGVGICVCTGASGELYYGEIASRPANAFRVTIFFKNSPSTGGLRTPMQAGQQGFGNGVPRNWDPGTASRQLSVLFSYTPA